jgi:hypothetical protein
MVTDMPRANLILVGETFQQILTRTLPSTIAGLEKLGLRKEVHYFVGRRAPKKFGWYEPYQPPLDYARSIHFATGAVINLVSQDRAGSGRGLNTDGIIGDECNLLDFDKLNIDTLATMRGSDARLKGREKFMNTLFVGTTPLDLIGKWMYKKEEEAMTNPERVLYIRASSYENFDNLGQEWFELMKRTMPDFLYKAEIENIRPKSVEDGFYPLLSDDHMYTNFNYDYYDGVLEKKTMPQVEIINSKGDRDCDSSKPLEIAVDWGASINCMVVCQQDGDRHNFIKEFYVKSPKILDSLFTEEFIPYYRHHRKKVVYFYYDRNGNSHLANSNMTFFEQACSLLEQAGWEVHGMTHGLDPFHQDKYQLWNILLSEAQSHLPVVRFNKSNCKCLITSMQNAPAKDVKGIQKDKSSERKKNFPQEEATHFSDAADIIIYGKFKAILEGRGVFVPNIFL